MYSLVAFDTRISLMMIPAIALAIRVVPDGAPFTIMAFTEPKYRDRFRKE